MSKKKHFLGNPDTRVRLLDKKVTIRAACGLFVDPEQLVNRREFCALTNKIRCMSCAKFEWTNWRMRCTSNS